MCCLPLALHAQTPTLVVNGVSFSFPSVAVGTTGSMPLNLYSTGTAPVTISSATVAGNGFAISGAKFPLTLKVGQTATINVLFHPAAAGPVGSGTLTFASNSSSGSSSAVSLYGWGTAVNRLSCASGSLSGAATDLCTVGLNADAPSGGVAVKLASSNSGLTVPASVTVPSGANSATFTATASAVSTTQTATLKASTGSVSSSYAVKLNGGTPTLVVNGVSFSFPSVAVGTTGSTPLNLYSTGTAPVTISSATVAGTGFAISGATFPLTLKVGQTATINVLFSPAAAGPVGSGTLTFASNSSSGSSTVVSLYGWGTAVNGLSCSRGSLSGSATDLCTVSLNAAAPSAGVAVKLASSSSALAVPATVTVPSGASSATFTATASAVSTTQTATLKASTGSVSSSYGVQLNAADPGLTLSTSSLSFGNVSLNTPTTQAVTLTATGAAALTINSIGVSGSGFSVSGINTPLTLNPGQTASLTVEFDPAAAGAVSGSVTLSTNATSGSTFTVGLSGTGLAPASLAGIGCSSGSETGAATDACTLTLTAAAPSGGMSVALASSSSAVSVPASVTIASGATSAAFTAAVSAVSTAQTATLTASEGGISKSYALQLNAATAALALSSSSVAFGNVSENTPATQSVTVTSNGTAALTISGASVSGAGFSMSGLAVPATLNPGQTATLNVEFDPTTAGAATGTVTLTTNASSGTTAAIALSGTGQAASYQVNLNWTAPSSTSDPVTGYNIYRQASGGSSYQLLNSSVNAPTSFTDSTVQSSTTYNYYIESVDAQGHQSSPSNIYTVTVP